MPVSSATSTQPEQRAGTANDTEQQLELVVAARELLSEQIVSLVLESPDKMDLPLWTPGAHIDVLLPNGLVRQYSLCGPTADRSKWRVAVLRDRASRGGSEYIHSTLHVGDRVSIRGPRNNFELAPSPRYIFLAGGIGVTPLIPMARQLSRDGADWEFLYCGRERSGMAFLGELQTEFEGRLTIHSDAERGYFDFAGFFADPRADTDVYVCGPGPFLEAVLAATAHWPKGSVHFERFAVPPVETANTSFEVELARTSRVLTVPTDKSVLEVLRGNGVPLLSSCEEGTCGTCEVAVLAGEIDHRDAVLSPEEQESGEMMMVCVSRCRGRRLVLDL